MLLAMGAALPAAQQGAPSCPVPPPTTPDPGTFQHRWAGMVFDSFTLDGQEVWTGEDGGRIRHRGPTGIWSFQSVPLEVQGKIHRIHFLPNGLDGWAVSNDGYVLRTIDGGASGWTLLARVSGAYGLTDWENLYDIWVAENGIDGWLVGLHGIWYSTTGGTCWQEADLYNGTVLLHGFDIGVNKMELWALDVRIGGDPAFLGLAIGQPGWILRSDDLGRTWHIVLRAYADLTVDPSECLAPAMTHPASSNNLFQLWDVEISLHADPEQALALVVGGVGNHCGVVLASADEGLTWAREYHECDPPDGTLPDYCTYPPYAPDPSDPLASRHHTEFNLLYGVAIDPSDNTAIATGYAGQLVRREVLLDGTPIWRDRSEFGSWDLVPDFAKTMPMRGVSLGGSPAVAYATGMGGTIRRSTDGGDTWSDETVGEPFRIHDVWFKFDPDLQNDVGWQIGQFFRLAYSLDGGLTWIEGLPARQFPEALTLLSLTFAANGMNGVAVGTHIPGSPQNEGPRILRTDDFGITFGWQAPSLITYASLAEQDVHRDSRLRRVAWGKDANHLHFWAVGSKGLILRTTDGGDKWTQELLPIANPHGIELHGVAAGGPNGIVVVGSLGVEPDPTAAKAWSWNGSIWTEIPIDATPPGGIELLTDVAVLGSQIYAVGQRENALDGSRTGVVLRYDSGSFDPFPGPLDPDELTACGFFVGNEHNRVLNRVALNSNGDLWIAGQCGQVWQHVAATSTWRQHKSQTDADVRGMMFLSPTRGYVGAHGGDGTNQVVVRYQEPGQ